MSSYTPEPYRGDRLRLEGERPTSVTVIAILHLVFGGFGCLFGLCGVVMQAAGPMNFIPKPPPPPAGAKAPPFPADLGPRMQQHLEAEIPFYNTILLTQLVLGLFLSIMLVIAGIGLLSMRPWSRRLSLVYAIGSIVLQLAGLVFMVLFTLPAMANFFPQIEREFPAIPPPVVAISRLAMWAGPIFAPVGFVYPIVVLVLLTRTKVRVAFFDQQTRLDLPEQPWSAQRTDPPSDAFMR
jgi:hypothetical protein